LEPWTTLPALFIVLGLICLGLFLINKRPLFAWGVLFFFINQVIESSIFPLELVFEHRNYLPSLFLFVPVTAFLLNPQRHREPRGIQNVQWHRLAIFLIILLFGMGTFVRNQVWHSEKSLWEDALRKAPGSARVYHNLAWSHYQRMGLYQEALKRYKKALQLRGEGNPRNFSTYLNVAAIYTDVGDYNRAVYFYREALKMKPGNRNAHFGLCLALVKRRQFAAAQKQLDGLLARYADEADYLNLQGFILLKTGQPQLAMPIFSQSLQRDPALSDALLNMGVALGLVGRYAEARAFLHRALEKHADRNLVLLALVDNAIRSEDSSRTETYISQLVDLVPKDRLDQWIGGLKNDGRSVPLSYDLLLEKISEKVK
jgi:Tfp pilus assembly protein PilF